MLVSSGMPHKLTCTIITKNEADRIGRTLHSVMEIADDIVIVDSGSSDDTVKICEDMGARCFHNDWPGFGPQKRLAEDKGKHDWILNLDADEVLSEDLIFEIRKWKLSGKSEPYGYRFKQVTVYPNDEKPRLFADYHHYIRLYDRRHMRFADSLVHDVVEPKGRAVGTFEGNCLHYSYRSLDHLEHKLDSYTSLQAREIKKPFWQLKIRQPFEYPILFFRYYVVRRHFTGGFYGLKTAHVIAKGRAARIRKFLEAQG